MSIMRASMLTLLTVIALTVLTGTARGEAKGTYLYTLSDFTGSVPTSSARVSVDDFHKEVYVTSGDLIRVFNDKGMEIYSFGENLNVGVLYDAAVDEKGNIYVLSHSYERKQFIITLCNFRGEPIREISLTNIPPQFQGISPSRMVYRKGTLYLVSDSGMVVVMTDANGVFKDGIDLFPLMDVKSDDRGKRGRKGEDRDKEKKELKRDDYGISGFSVDHEGNLLFVSPITAKAFIVFADRTVDSFGKRGSAPGRFAIPRGIVRDKSGNYIVSDILRCVVMIFDKKFDFITEFGGRGYGPSNLIGPTEIVLSEDSKLYVTQLTERGVSVYNIVGD
ncbi:conserved exported hypothetical protein [Candidatus Sulfobium mesophilum]|uniref:NHL repeat containing protein n=1 Tax=Candidatus Sulfobium mesophilum TaxID=2016548 RepID=A0A2U3QGJ9_9BACT|nr:conserved exported hypothetical protein [Candidatus Sulfobium mesophilum]